MQEAFPFRDLLTELEHCLSVERMGTAGVRVIDLNGVARIANAYGISRRASMKLCLDHDIWPLRFVRNSGVFSPGEQRALLDAHVVVAGCGGLGGYVAQLLARAGVGGLTLCDGDVFCESNLNRQAGCREDTLGLNKAEGMAQVVASIAAHLSLSVFPVYLSSENVAKVIEGADLVVDCLDSLQARVVLAKAARSRGLPFVHGAIAGHEGFVAVALPEDDTLGSMYGDSLPSQSECAEAVMGAPTVTPAATACLQCSLALQALLKKRIRPGVLHHFDVFAPFLESLSL